MKTSQDAQRIILEVVRGERPWTDLLSIDIKVSLETNPDGHLSARIDNPKEHSATAEASDLAQGLLCYRKDHDQLRTWAFVLEAGSFVDFNLVDSPDSDLLLDALWDASYGEELDPAAVRLAEELSTRAITTP